MTDLQYIALKGHGYFCQVKLYRHKTTGLEFAFKELRKEHYPKDEYRYRLSREISILKELQDCANVVPMIDSGEDQESMSIWYLMPFAKFNLFDYIRRYNVNLTVEERFAIIDQVIVAIKYAHDRKILHRDISPNNVLVYLENGSYIVRVADFGLGKDAESISHYTASSSSGYGQILYVSPEQRQKLKDATFQSDLYSLGKLVYFIYTGRDPDNMRPFELSSLVAKATEDIPERRHKSIQEFEQHYVGLRELQLDNTIPLEYVTIAEIAESNEKVDIHYLHKVLVRGNYLDHVYSDYLAPVVKLFGNVEFLRTYYANVGTTILEFVSVFCERLDECYDRTGWPFKAATDFGLLLKRILTNVATDQVRLLCLKQLWKLAFEMDQWAIQREIKDVLNEKYISSTIAPSFAEYIINLEIEVDLDRFQGVPLPIMIKKAIINGNVIAISKANARKSASGLDSLDEI
nr:serine/threonine-protein kinase [uncultured Dyadobacter sp.]